ncbi:MAG: hypothetical protein OXU78_11310 [Deltaproteobacteria bacterium]|nr:hypothetical protein [Deltaproteobacteria bacterium]
MEAKLEPIEVALARRWAEFRRRLFAGAGRFLARAKGEQGAAGHSLWFLLVLGVALNLINIAVPGYFGKDDISHHLVHIAGRSLGDAVGAVGWLDFSKVHYRPLSFKIWYALSFFFFEKPVLYHLCSTLQSVLNGLLIYHLVMRISGQKRAALWAFLAFNVFPSSAFVVGWGLATTADKLYLTFALIAAHILLSDRNAALRSGPDWSWELSRPEILRQAGIALCLVLGLMSKETMIPFPAFIAGLCLLVKPWRGWIWSLLASSAIVGIYLAIRLQDMLFDNPYGPEPPSLANVLSHMLHYWLWPAVWSNYQLQDVIAVSSQLNLWWAALLASLPVALLLARRKWRWALAYLGYYYVFVSPVLIHCCTYVNLLYGAAFSVAVMFAYVFRRGERAWVRAVACAVFAVLAAHSAHIQWSNYKNGVMQRAARSSLAAIVRVHDRRAGNEQTQFAIVAKDDWTWHVLYNGFWPPSYQGMMDVDGLNLFGRVTVHQPWPGPFHEIPEGPVRLRMTPKGYLVEE